MSDCLSEAEYDAFKNANIGETVAAKTKQGNEYVLQTTDRKGATLIGIAVVDGSPSVLELRGGRGRDGQNNHPWIALGVGGPESVETTDVEEGVTYIDGIGAVNMHRERGTISYDEEVIRFDRRGDDPITLG